MCWYDVRRMGIELRVNEQWASPMTMLHHSLAFPENKVATELQHQGVVGTGGTAPRIHLGIAAWRLVVSLAL
jgi:hypothetical protein